MLLFLVAVSILFWFINFLKKKMLVRTSSNELSSGIKFLLLFLTIGLAIHAARGFNKKHPPQIKEAFFSKNVFINQLSINPVLSFFESISIFKIDYMPDEKALALAQKSLNCNQPVSNSPIARIEQNDSRVGKKNVVLVLMEGMSAYKTGRFEPQKKLTPFLDSLSNVGLFFPNFFSCGIHTCNGVYGTLFGFPSLMAIHPLSNVASSNLYFDGMPSTLKKNGYTNLFFCTHDDQFDNMNYFLMRNGIDKMFGAKDYPASMRENVWGINDEYLFDFALRKTDSLAETGNPFFSTILTISTHPPHQTPKLTKFKPKSLQVIDQVYEYADFALQKFLKSCAEKKWFDNTVFIFVADHGINLPSNLEAPLSFNHVPLIIYCSDTSFKPAEVESFGMQTDIYPTVMSLLGISFLNNTMGVNLLKHQRPFAYFSQDNRLCVINNNRLLIINKYGSRYFYDYKRGISINAEGSNTSTIDSMANYAYSMLQTTQWMIEKKLVGMNK
jgi:phosphoglycerol transferase MdoB-like AlkP superfamily enzyme